MTRTNDHSGIAKVYLDNVAVKSVDLYSATEKFQKTVFAKEWSKAGKHTIKISRTGKLNKASAGRGISLDAFVVTDRTPPPVMTKPTARASHRAIELSWGASPATDVTAYRVYRKVGSGKYVRIAQVPAAVLSYTSVGLVHGATYRFRLTAVDSSGNVSGTAPSASALMPKTATVSGRYTKCPTATRSVDTAAELTDALATAGPGSVIRLAPGTYSGYFATPPSAPAPSRSGSVARARRSSIRQTTPRDRDLASTDASHVIITGMTVKNALKGVIVTGGRTTPCRTCTSPTSGTKPSTSARTPPTTRRRQHDRTDRPSGPGYGEGDLRRIRPRGLVRHVGLRSPIAATAISSTRTPSGPSPPKPSRSRPERPDGDIRNNVINGAAMTEANSGGWIVIKGNGWLVEANRGTSAPEHGFSATYSRDAGWGRDNVFVGNEAAVNNASATASGCRRASATSSAATTPPTSAPGPSTWPARSSDATPLTVRSGRGLGLLRLRPQQVEAFEFVGQAGAVGGVEPGDVRAAADRVVAAGAAGQHRLAGGQLADADRPDVLGVPIREVGVDGLVVLPVVADEQPADLRELPASRSRLERLWSWPLRNQRSAVGPQSVSSRAPAG